MPLDIDTAAGTARPGQPITDATVWTAADYPDDRSWVHPISESLLDDIDAGVRAVKAQGIEPKAIRRHHFPLPRAEDFLESVERDMEAGPGFALLSGFPVTRYGYDDLVLAYCGLMSHFGDIAIQSRAGEYVVDVSNKGRGYSKQARGHYSNAYLQFHNDGTHTVTLLCVETAPVGGRSLLISAPAVYNAILAERPDLLTPLLRGFHHHRREERGPEDPVYTPWRTPVFGFYGGQFHVAYTRNSVNFCESEGVEITPHEVEALDFLDSVIKRPELQVSMALEKGDLQLVNNNVALHSRTAFEDGPDQKRHLIRLWLDKPGSRYLGPGKMDWYMPEHSLFLKTRGHLLEGYDGRYS